MNKQIRALLCLLATALFFSNSVVMAQTSFQDVAPNSINLDAISSLRTGGVIEGVGENKYEPLRNINRAEFVKIATLMLPEAKNMISSCIKAEDREKGFVKLKDVKADVWYAPYVCVAVEQGLVKGYSDQTFKPERNISFAEASKIVLNVFDHKDVSEDGKEWFSNYLEKMEELRDIPTDVKGPHSLITRGQMAEIVWRLKDNIDYKPSQTASELNKSKLLTGEAFPKIESCIELEEKVAARNYRVNYLVEDSMVLTVASESAAGAAQVAPMATKSANESSAREADYSQTNIQVAGVDEADIVKNDGSYIYVVRKNTVRIFQATPAEELKELSKVDFGKENFSPNEIYVTGDKLVVVGREWHNYMPRSEKMAMDIAPGYYGESMTKVYIFDISDRSNPEEERNVAIQGDLTSSRRIGEYVYLVMNKYPSFSYPMPLAEDLLPRMTDSAMKEEVNVETNAEVKVEDSVSEMDVMVEENSVPLVDCDDISYFPGFNEPNYLIVAAIPLNDLSKTVEREVILGAGSQVYSSLRNLYVATYEYNYPEVVDSANPVDGEYGEMTAIYKFDLNEGKVKFSKKGSVPGNILNQFSMDEYGPNFRIATTKYGYKSNEWLETNNLFVLNSDLQVVGSIRDIAPGERIYSTRFMGDRGYMVTFKKVDPLFVFDLKDPKNPKILGKLKIPGFSDYLHPYDENHIIGFGKDTVEPSEEESARGFRDFAWYQGMKIAMFDITNVEEPKQKFVEVIGDRGTDSELLYNHKALLFDKSKNLMAFPISVAEIPADEKEEASGSSYGDTIFQGAYVYNVDLENGFTLKGKVTHYDDPEAFVKAGDYFYGEQGLNISRVVRIGDYLYSISEDVIKALTLDKVEEKKKIEIVD